MEKQQAKQVEAWLLPSQLNCDDFFAEGKKWKEDCLGFAFPSEIPFLFSSSPDSPVDSVTETETESEDEDYLAGLTQRMAHSFLHDDDEDSMTDDSLEGKEAAEKPKIEDMAVSEELTEKLPSIGDGLIKNSLLPLPTLESKNEPVNPQDLLQLAQLTDLPAMQNQSMKKPEHGVSVLQNKIGASFLNASKHNKLRVAQPQTQFCSKCSLVKSHQLPQPAVLEVHNKARSEGIRAGNYRALGLPSSAWPPLQKQPISSSQHHQEPQQHPVHGSGMRPVFLNCPVVKKESVGTGVFLPRIAGSKTELPPRRRQACSPVLVPARVVQALNLNLEQLRAQPRFTNAGAYAEYILNQEMISRSNNLAAYQKQRGHFRPQNQAVSSGDVHFLPQEWTY